jgi:hypothetical protein
VFCLNGRKSSSPGTGDPPLTLIAFCVFQHYYTGEILYLLGSVYLFFFGGMGFKPRASAWKVCKAGTLLLEAHLQSILFWLFCRWGSCELFALGLASTRDPPHLSLLSSWDYRCQPPALEVYFYLFIFCNARDQSQGLKHARQVLYTLPLTYTLTPY